MQTAEKFHQQVLRASMQDRGPRHTYENEHNILHRAEKGRGDRSLRSMRAWVSIGTASWARYCFTASSGDSDCADQKSMRTIKVMISPRALHASMFATHRCRYASGTKG
jgi:hypothetical protein